MRNLVLPGLGHNSSIQRLNRSSVVRIEFSKCPDLRSGSLQRRLEHDPEDGLSTRRRGLRSCVGVVTKVARKQARGIDDDSAGGFLTFIPRHVPPDGLNCLVHCAPLDHDSDTCNFAILSPKHQVSLHFVWFPLDVFLARMVEMKLRKLISPDTDDKKVSTPRRVRVIHANGVAVVDHVSNRSTPEFKPDRGKVRCPRVSNIDRRLCVARVARCVRRIERTPAVSFFIGPWCSPWRLIVLFVLSARESRLHHGDSQDQNCDAVVSQVRLPMSLKCGNAVSAPARHFPEEWPGMLCSMSKC